MEKDSRIFDYWKECFLEFVRKSDEWDVENYMPPEDRDELTPSQKIRKASTFGSKFRKLLDDYGVNLGSLEIREDSPFYRELNPFGSNWIIPNGVISHSQEMLKCNECNIEKLKERISLTRRPRSSPGPKRKLFPQTARAILVGIYMLKLENLDCTPMRNFLSSGGEFEDLATGTTIQGFYRSQSESINEWVDGAKDRCLEAILPKKDMKDSEARANLRASAEETARKFIEQEKVNCRPC